MRLTTPPARSMAGLLFLSALAATPLFTCVPASAQERAQRAPGSSQAEPMTTLETRVPGFVTRATRLGAPDPQQTLPIVVSLKFARPDAAQTYADSVSDPASPLYRQFLKPEEIADRFGPSEADYQAVVAHLKAAGLQITGLSANRLSVLAEGSVPQLEVAFATRLGQFREAQTDRVRRAGRNAAPLTFFANETPPLLPARLAPLVEGVAGLENYVRATPKLKRRSSAPYEPKNVRTAYSLAPLFNTPRNLQGQGRSIGIVSLEYTIPEDTTDFINHFKLSVPAEGVGANITLVNVKGGASSSSFTVGEANLDIQMVLGMAPLAKVYIYNSDGNFNYFSHYLAIVTKIASDNKVDIVTDSWGITPSSTSQYTQFHNQHLLMTLQGITYLNATGDYGSDLSVNGLYPETDPDVLAVGGTVMRLDTNDHITSEKGWHGSGGGYSSSAPFARPSYQKGRGVNTSINFRQLPDISLHSATATDDSSYQFYFGGVITSGIGTSFASPICAGSLAVVEQYLINKGVLPADSSNHRRLGRLNDTIYAMNGRSDVFHDITQGASDSSFKFPNGFSCTPFWDAVTGWGSVNFTNLAAALAAPLSLTVTPETAQVKAGKSLTLTATVRGSNSKTVTWKIVSGPGSVSSTGVYKAPLTVSGPTTVVVRATSIINLATPLSDASTLTVVP